jgi:hypothetical protein
MLSPDFRRKFRQCNLQPGAPANNQAIPSSILQFVGKRRHLAGIYDCKRRFRAPSAPDNKLRNTPNLRKRKFRVVYGGTLRNLEQMDVHRSIRPSNEQVQRNLYAIECFVIAVVDLGGIKAEGRRAET